MNQAINRTAGNTLFMRIASSVREHVGLCPFDGSTVKECNLFTRSFCSIRLYETTSFPKICNEIMHHSMLPSIVSCSRLWNFAWRLLLCSTTESKNIVKLLAISQTIHTVCCEDDWFPKRKFKLFNSLFHSVYLVFPKSLFSIADLFPVRLNALLWHSKRQTFASLGLFTFLVYICMYCVPIATLNQNKRSRLLHLDDAFVEYRKRTNIAVHWTSK